MKTSTYYAAQASRLRALSRTPGLSPFEAQDYAALASRAAHHARLLGSLEDSRASISHLSRRLCIPGELASREAEPAGSSL